MRHLWSKFIASWECLPKKTFGFFSSQRPQILEKTKKMAFLRTWSEHYSSKCSKMQTAYDHETETCFWTSTIPTHLKVKQTRPKHANIKHSATREALRTSHPATGHERSKHVTTTSGTAGRPRAGHAAAPGRLCVPGKADAGLENRGVQTMQRV